MQVRDAAHADLLDELIVGLDLRSRQHLLDHKGLQRRLRRDLAREARTIDQRLEIIIAGEEIEPDLGRRRRVRALDAHRAAPLGPQMHRRKGKSRKRVRLDAGAQPFERAPAGHVDLQIGLFEARVALDQRAGIDPGIRQVPRAREHILRPGHKLLDAAHRQIVDRDRLGAAPHEIGVEMVVQMRADPRHVTHHRDPVRCSIRPGRAPTTAAIAASRRRRPTR